MTFALMSKSKTKQATPRKLTVKPKPPSILRAVKSPPGLGVRSSISAPIIQPKLKIGEPNDKYEQEADRVADEVMRMPDSVVSNSSVASTKLQDSGTSPDMPHLHRRCAKCESEAREKLRQKPVQSQKSSDHFSPIPGSLQAKLEFPGNILSLQKSQSLNTDSGRDGLPNIQRLCSQCGGESQQRLFRNSDDDELGNNRQNNQSLQRKQEANQAATTVTPDTESRIHALQVGGQPLSESSKAFFEPRFGQDFSQVRVHTDSQTAKLARSVSARAFTVGQHIVFGAGEYSSGSSTGRRLLAHELTHTLQQQGTTQPCTKKSPANEVTPVQHKVQRLGDLSEVPPGLACPVANSSPASTIRNVMFPVSVFALNPTQKSEVEQVAQSWHAVGSNPVIRVDGYASTDGSDPLNWELSCRRALAVKNELENPSSGAPGIPNASIEVFAQGETDEFGAGSAARPLNRRATISTTSPLPVPVCTHPGVSRTLDLQPVFFRSSAADPSPTGGSWGGRFNESNRIWGKLGVTFNQQSPVTLISRLKTTGSTLAERNSIRALRTAAGIEVFLMDNDLSGAGGGATTGSGSAPAKIVMSDRGTSNTLLAHELGHVLGLGHPPVSADPNTIMTASSSNSTPNPTRNTMNNFNRITFPAPSGSTCLLPDA